MGCLETPHQLVTKTGRMAASEFGHCKNPTSRTKANTCLRSQILKEAGAQARGTAFESGVQ
jgi:hypothetical protein